MGHVRLCLLESKWLLQDESIDEEIRQKLDNISARQGIEIIMED